MNEVKARRYAGLFKKQQLPFKNYVQSPIGLVPKAGGKTRLIFHLSFDFGMKEEQRSVNFHTPKHRCTVQYHDLDFAILTSMNILKQTNKSQLYYAKSDFSNAFRILEICVQHRFLLVMKSSHLETNEIYYFIDKYLPFRASISCAHFQSFLDAIKHIVDWKIKLTFFIRVPSTTNYLDDFLFAAISRVICNEMVNIFLKICQQIGCPIADEKTEWVMQIIVFLGILLNGRTLTLIIPTERRISAINLLLQAIQEKR